MINIKSKFKFTVSPRFEPFFALQTLTDPESRIHGSWKADALRRLPPRFHRALARTGTSPFLWPMVADAPGSAPLTLSFGGLIARLAALPARDVQERIFLGVFHDRREVQALLSGRRGIAETIARLTRVKREWLGFIGVYPAVRDSPLVMALESLLRAPGEFQKTICDLLHMFWDVVFRETWELLLPKLQESCEEKERLFESCTLAEFARLALLRVEVDERRGALKAVRGGAAVALKEVEEVIVLPSAFNDQRHWTAYGAKAIDHVYIPYFEPSVSLSWIGRSAEMHRLAEPEMDPALIFKALGDATRYGMVSMLARRPSTAADLARTLRLSRPTVSHHIHVLREAGLLEEKVQGNAVLLNLRREVFEHLSALVTQKLFHSTQEINLKKTRNP